MSDEPTKATNPDETGQKVETKFKSGAEWKGNAAGRPKGSRSKLSEEFLADLLEDWREGGVTALKAARVSQPGVYCKIVASLLPKELTVKNELSEFTDEQLAALSALAASLIGGHAGGAQEDRDGAGAKALN